MTPGSVTCKAQKLLSFPEQVLMAVWDLVVLSPFDQIEKLKSFSEGEILSQRQTQ
jgi:hypothetical protein